MKKNNVLVALLIIGDLLLLVTNFHLVGGLGAYKIDNTINTLDFVSFIVTVTIALLVPFLIKKAIDDNKGIKTLLIDEVKSLICLAELNHKVISDLYSESATIESNHKDSIRENFFDIELKIDSLRTQFEISYPSKIKVIERIFEQTLIYKQFLTDGKFFISTYTNVDHDFYRDEKNAFAKFQKSLIGNIHEIHKF